LSAAFALKPLPVIVTTVVLGPFNGEALEMTSGIKSRPFIGTRHHHARIKQNQNNGTAVHNKIWDRFHGYLLMEFRTNFSFSNG
jgi:hypothetical protein